MSTHRCTGTVTADQTLHVGIGDCVVGDGAERLRTYGLGSCVAVAVYDPETSVGGMAHVMLPQAPTAHVAEPGKYANTAIPALLAEIESRGGDRESVRAMIAGGSDMFGFGEAGGTVGDRNVSEVKAALTARDIPIIDEHVGGMSSRTVTFDLESGTLSIEGEDGGEDT